MNIINQEPAFPIPGLQDDPDFNGMSLRDYFAARAMQVYASDWSDVEVAQMAYKTADAMIKERMK